jgi:hypothetical protein
MSRWKDFLRGSAPPAHGVQVYDDVVELTDSVAEYLAAGFEAGEPALVVATREHLSCFTERLQSAGWDAERLESDGLLVLADAHSMLASIVRDGRPSAIAFDAVVGTLLDQAAERHPGATPRVFGEMVDVLFHRGLPEAALALEELWNELGRGRRFSLLCGYQSDGFDAASRTARLQEVCRLHSHVQVTATSPGFAAV